MLAGRGAHWCAFVALVACANSASAASQHSLRQYSTEQVVDVDETKKQITDHGDALNKVVQNVPSLPACSMASVALRGMWSSGSLPDTLETLKTAYADPAYRLAADS